MLWQVQLLYGPEPGLVGNHMNTCTEHGWVNTLWRDRLQTGNSLLKSQTKMAAWPRGASRSYEPDTTVIKKRVFLFWFWNHLISWIRQVLHWYWNLLSVKSNLFTHNVFIYLWIMQIHFSCIVLHYILTLHAPMETLVSHAVGPVPPDIVPVFLPITPGHFQHDHGKHELFIELFIEHNIFSKTSTKPSLTLARSGCGTSMCVVQLRSRSMATAQI